MSDKMQIVQHGNQSLVIMKHNRTKGCGYRRDAVIFADQIVQITGNCRRLKHLNFITELCFLVKKKKKAAYWIFHLQQVKMYQDFVYLFILFDVLCVVK